MTNIIFAMTDSLRPSESESAPLLIPVCRFEGVELRQDDCSVTIDGRPRPCSRKAFELIWALCRQPRRTRARDALIAEVWPGGQLVSDEALTQMVFRARNVLGPYGGLIRTVRGIGFALDAEVEQLQLPVPAPASPVPMPANNATVQEAVIDAMGANAGPREPASETVLPESVRWDGGIRLARALFVALLLLALPFVTWMWSQRTATLAPDIDDGYGFTLEDLAPTHPDTADLFAQALDQDARGDRGRAVALMRIAHETDGATPLPALMLALWAGGTVDQAGVREWMEAADARLDARATPLVRLFRDYVDASAAIDSQRVVATAGALLGLRPGAWRMRHARAHLLEYRGMRDAALDELRQVEFPALGHRRRDQIIADLASFGDPDAAERILDRLASDPEQATWHFLRGRLAWSRQQWGDAVHHLGRSRELAHRQGRMDLQWRALIYKSVALVILGRDVEATTAAEQARALMGQGNPIDELDMTILLAGLRAERGQQELLAEELQRLRGLLSTVVLGDSQVSGWLLLLRMDVAGPEEGPAIQRGSAQEGLWRAARLTAAGDEVAAREALAVALERGIAATRLLDDTRYLQTRLGLPVSVEQPLDPPHAPLSRVLLRRVVARLMADGIREESP